MYNHVYSTCVFLFYIKAIKTQVKTDILQSANSKRKGTQPLVHGLEEG